MPAPKKNTNAASSGLYTRRPTHKYIVPPGADLHLLSDAAGVLADYSMWIAKELDSSQRPDLTNTAIVLYAAVAHECTQAAAEIEGNGLKSASLGNLSENSYQHLQNRTAEALSLTLSQIKTAVARIQDVQAIEGNGLIITVPENKTTGESAQQFLNPVIAYMAGMMRSAKRMLTTMAANRKWYQMREVKDDLADRIMQEIIQKENNYES